MKSRPFTVVNLIIGITIGFFIGLFIINYKVQAYSPAPVGITMQSICPTFLSKPLKYGDRNSDVVMLQLLLIKDGQDIPAGATGYYGVQTKAAVSDFQLKYSFQILFPLKLSAPTGAVYSATLAQLNALNCDL